jgi:hypothetical protein
MRISRGLFRLWVVLSVLWISLVAVHTWSTFPSDVRLETDEEVGIRPNSLPPPPSGFVIDKPRFDPTKPYQIVRDAERRNAIQFALMLAVAPPAFAFALGSALLWVVRGFGS